jgi:hypothetical protein
VKTQAPGAPYTVDTSADGLVRLHFFLPRRQVATARFILEGYDHLGVQTSAPGSSRVVWTVPVALRADAESLLGSILSQMNQ